jgi:hypothetical protein
VSDNLKAKGCGRRFSYNVCGEEQRFCFTCTSAIALNLQERAEKAEAENLNLKAIITKYSHCLPQDAVLDIAKSGILKSGGES